MSSTISCVSVILVALLLSTTAHAQEPMAALRIRFGMKDKQPTDWSGTLTPSAGKVESIRFSAGSFGRP